MRGRHYREQRPVTEKGSLKRVSVRILKISNFKEAKKDKIVKCSKKRLKIIRAYTESTD